MKIHLKLLTERYWFRLGLSLCFAITAALSYADRDFIWMGLSLCLLLFSIWWQLSLYRIHTKRVLFLLERIPFCYVIGCLLTGGIRDIHCHTCSLCPDTYRVIC